MTKNVMTFGLQTKYITHLSSLYFSAIYHGSDILSTVLLTRITTVW